jgi:hypothetical protein
MWMLLQSTVAFAVMASNIHWGWTPNGYLASLVAAGAAYGATVAINELLIICRRKRPVAKRSARQ